MKRQIRNLIRVIVKNRYAWMMIQPIMKVADYFSYHHSDQQIRPEISFQVNPIYIPLFGEPVVKNGPLKGLQYPGFKSFGSMLYPKLLGSYESEISWIIEKVCSGGYENILDIGSAEGYYAVGIALRNRNAKVYAFDTNQRANEFCAEMADLNGVSDRLVIGDFCSSETLASMDFSKKTFILCDCEGYEKYLFNKNNITNLSKCDLLIETHDFMDMTISINVIELFKNTHRCTVIRSIDDIDKARTYQYTALAEQNLNVRREILSEGRPGLMEWVYLESI